MEFLYPNVLWVILLPVIVLIVLIATNKDSMQIVFDENILAKLAVKSSYMKKSSRNILFFAAIIFMTISLARPVMNNYEQEVKQKLVPIVVAIDVSRSMFANDIFPNRLELAKKKVKNIISISKTSAIGVVLFAKSAFMLSPVTEDFSSLLYLVNNLDTGLNFDNGSNIMAMIESSNDLMRDFNSKNIILFSDGGNSEDYSKEAEYAKKHNINIFAIGLATKKGSPIPTKDGYLTDENGNIVTVGLNENIISLAKQSGGGYIGYSLGDADIEAVISEILTRSKKIEMRSQKIKIYTELFYYPLAFAIIILLFAFSSFPKFKKIKK